MRSAAIYCQVFLLVFFLAGCEKDVENVRMPPFGQKLVVASFISPSDSLSSFSVSSNRKIYGLLGEPEEIGTISGTISDGITEVQLDTARYGLKISSNKMPVVCGRTYTLKIKSDKGFSVSANCTVPEKRNFTFSADTFSILMPYYPPGFYQRRIDLKLTIHDIAGEANYYRVAVKGYGYGKNPVNGKIYSYSGDLYLEKELFSDAGCDGKDITIKTLSGINYYFDSDSAFFTVYLYNVEKSYYLYHKSLDNYNGEENPFSEISPVYSNISGGLGIFTSYTLDTLSFRMK